MNGHKTSAPEQEYSEQLIDRTSSFCTLSRWGSMELWFIPIVVRIENEMFIRRRRREQNPAFHKTQFRHNLSLFLLQMLPRYLSVWDVYLSANIRFSSVRKFFLISWLMISDVFFCSVWMVDGSWFFSCIDYATSDWSMSMFNRWIKQFFLCSKCPMWSGFRR